MAGKTRQGDFYPTVLDNKSEEILDVLDQRWLDFFNILKNTRFTTHMVKQNEEGDLPNIADKQYQDRTLWWFIAHMNNIKNPLEDTKAGVVLKIPVLTELVSALNASSGASKSKASTVRFPRNTA